VTLTSTKLYDFCDPTERAEWLDVLIALIEYLRSGESKVGFLNKSMDKNMLHKVQEDAMELENKESGGDTVGEVAEGSRRGEVGLGDDAGLEGSSTLRRPSRKRGLAFEEADGWDTKVRRKA